MTDRAIQIAEQTDTSEIVKGVVVNAVRQCLRRSRVVTGDVLRAIDREIEVELRLAFPGIEEGGANWNALADKVRRHAQLHIGRIDDRDDTYMIHGRLIAAMVLVTGHGLSEDAPGQALPADDFEEAIQNACERRLSRHGIDALLTRNHRGDLGIVQLPKIGDCVSRAFNGDYYPAGKVTSISKSGKVVTTSDGTKFYRVRETSAWRADKTWWMTAGHVSKRNPEF